MSINRLVLRSLVCNALVKHDYDEDDVTIAGDNVFDSRLDPLQFDMDRVEIPTILVYSDEDEHKLWNRSNNSGPYLRHIDLRLELAVGSFEKMLVDKQDVVAYGIPETDALLEARLDLFEQQVLWALRYLDRPATHAIKAFVVRIEQISSQPFRDESSNNRIALRRVHIRCVVNDDCPPPIRYDDQHAVTRVLCPCDLPVAPWLQPALASLQNSRSMGLVISALGGGNGKAQVFPIFKKIIASVDYVRPAADPYLLAQLKKEIGPDKRIEHIAVWELNK